MKQKNKKEPCIEISENGPYLISGNIPITKEIIEPGPSGEPELYKKVKDYSGQETCALCRCGGSRNKPFCDGSHAKIKFDGKETADLDPFAKNTEILKGPGLVLKEVPGLCASARFCHFGKGTWTYVEASDNKADREMAIRTACNCPSGRLVVCDSKTGKPIEPLFKPSIAFLEDPQAEVSGPLFVRGDVTIKSSRGKEYKKRNRVTLCRCGKSKNKPFCDSSHIDSRFDDGMIES